jgi:hypothetical protein
MDWSVGARIYTRGATKIKGWIGGFGEVAIDTFTRLPLTSVEFAANEPEYRHYPELRKRMKDALGEDPLAVSGDRGISYDSVFESNTKDGVASVIPWRKRGQLVDREQVRCDRWDEHGVRRCEHCGGETILEAFFIDRRNGDPKQRLRCKDPIVPGCLKTVSRSCSDCWSLLLPMSRLEPSTTTSLTPISPTSKPSERSAPATRSTATTKPTASTSGATRWQPNGSGRMRPDSSTGSSSAA